jgi:UDP-glucose 4-epimerase
MTPQRPATESPDTVSGSPSYAFEASYKGLKAVVTGGLGFIGSNLARRLVELGAEVVVVDSLQAKSGGNPANLAGFENRLRVRSLDLRDCMQLPDVFVGQDVIFNLAGLVSHIDSMTDPVSDLACNVHAQIVFLEACRKHAPRARVIFASTRQIYGRPVRNPVDESHPLHPVDVNGVHKVAAEEYHTLYNEVYGLQTVCLRLTNTFGPRMRIKDARQTFLGVWIRRVVEDGAFEVWGGQQKRDLAYVDDVVDAFLLAAISSNALGKVFNIGGCSPVTLLQLADLLVAIGGTGHYQTKEFPPERLRIDIGDYFADDRMFRQATGWQPNTTLNEGLARTLAYYRENLSAYV